MPATRDHLRGPLSGLNFKLIATIVIVIMAVEVLIYLPSVANFRNNWLHDKLMVGAVAARVLDFVPDAMDLPQGLADRLLSSAEAEAIAYKRDDKSQLIQHSDQAMPKAAVTADTGDMNPLHMIEGALDTLLFGSDRTMRIVGPVPGTESNTVEVLVSEKPLRAAMLTYSRNIFILSLLVASMTALVLFGFVNRALIRPITRMVASMTAFRTAPENATLIVNPSSRRDEIGVAERELAAMQSDLFAMLRQRRHLAELGLAVAKINHDLRNTLTSAQLLSDQVATLDDPKVQRLAPRLVQTLDKAIGFTQSVLDYGRQYTAPPRRQPVDLRALVEEASFDAGLAGHPDIGFTNTVPDKVTLMVDPDQMARVFVNLMKNSREALEMADMAGRAPGIVVGYEDRGDDGIAIDIADNGPGLPPRAREKLFVAFEGSTRSGGTGLGLAIARDLTNIHGGTLGYSALDPGTRFEVCLPRTARAL